MTDGERRQHLRVHPGEDAGLSMPRMEEVRLVNLSPGGASIRHGVPLVRGETHVLSLRVGGQEVPLVARVVWSRPEPAPPEFPCRSGLQFVGLPPPTEGLLRDYLAVRMGEEPRRQNAAATRTVLVVDDDPYVRALMVDILEPEGFLCRTARNGVEALRACEVALPDLILLDIRMPEMDGLETCRRLKANPAWASVPVIVLTGLDEPQPVVHMLDAGSLISLAKPFPPERLLAAVRLALTARTP